MLKQKISFKNAYGQLIVLVFLPICVLMVVGSSMVYSETQKANDSEQKALAQALLIRYKPVIKKDLTEIVNGRTFPVNKNYYDSTKKAKTLKEINKELHDLMFRIQAELNLHRVALISETGRVYHSAGYGVSRPWFQKPLSLKEDFIPATKTSVGTAYGIYVGKAYIDGEIRKLWFFVDMDSQPLELAMYKVMTTLGIVGLFTIIVLLISLNFYSRRWISPIYDLRLYLQRINPDTLSREITMVAHGELDSLKRDLHSALTRLNDHFVELETHATETEDDLNQTLDEMESQNISMRHAQKQAESSNQAKSLFLANISHELRTPLNSIDGFINLLSRNETLADEHKVYIETIRKSSSHLLALVNDVLDFSKIEAGKLVLDSHTFDFYAAIYDVVDMLSPLASEKRLRMGVLFYNDVPLTIIGDELRFKQVLTNLVANAIKFTDSGEVLVLVSLDEDKDNFVKIAVQDSGKGVSEQNKKELFKSFSQGDPSITRLYGGTGLGLIISKQITRIMGGSIGFFDNNASHVATNGSTFWFDMPANLEVIDAPTANDFEKPLLTLSNLKRQNGDDKLHMLAWINHKASMQLLQVCLAPLDIEITQVNSLARTLEKLKEHSNYWNWVVVDSDANETADDMTALLKQVRLHYQGKLSVFGYQVALDIELLSRYKAFALHEPLDKRQLYDMLENPDTNKQRDVQENLRWQGYKVLAVDDHLPNLLVLEALLAEHGIEVITASNGFEAIEIINRHNLLDTAQINPENQIDLIFMDIQMPRMSGKETSLKIRSLEKSEHRIPIIALTAQGIADEKDALIASGIDDYVGKPISQMHLATVLQRWLGNKQKNIEIDINSPASYKIDNSPQKIIADVIPSSAFSDMSELTKTPIGVGRKVLNGSDISTLPVYVQEQKDFTSRMLMPAHDSVLIFCKKDGYGFTKLPYRYQDWYFNKWQEELNNYDIIDWQDGLQRSADKPDLTAKLIIMLIDSLVKEREELIQAWTNQDFMQLYQVNHRLLGASRYAGVPQLRQASQWLEDDVSYINEYLSGSLLKNDTNKNLSNYKMITIILSYKLVIDAIDHLIKVDVTPWPQLAFAKLSEEDMQWKMI